MSSLLTFSVTVVFRFAALDYSPADQPQGEEQAASSHHIKKTGPYLRIIRSRSYRPHLRLIGSPIVNDRYDHEQQPEASSNHRSPRFVVSWMRDHGVQVLEEKKA